MVERRNIDALVEDIHREDVLQLAIFELSDGCVAFVVGGFAAYGKGAIAPFVEEARKSLRFVVPTAENKPSAVFLADRILFDLSNDMINAFFRRQVREQCKIVRLPFVDFEIRDSEIVKRNEHIVFESVLKCNAIGDYVIE